MENKLCRGLETVKVRSISFAAEKKHSRCPSLAHGKVGLAIPVEVGSHHPSLFALNSDAAC
jgi:hypothetical protein